MKLLQFSLKPWTIYKAHRGSIAVRLNYPLMGVMFRSKCKIFLMKEDSVWLIHFQFSVFDQSMLCATDSLKSVLAKKSVRLCGCRHNAFLHHIICWMVASCSQKLREPYTKNQTFRLQSTESIGKKGSIMQVINMQLNCYIQIKKTF